MKKIAKNIAIIIIAFSIKLVLVNLILEWALENYIPKVSIASQKDWKLIFVVLPAFVGYESMIAWVFKSDKK
jgi:hypothetical protein